MANYTLSLDNFHISRTRALRNDTDYVSLTVQVDGQPATTQTRYMGDVHGGDHDVGLQIPFTVDSGMNVTFVYQIINSGYAASHEDAGQKILDGLSDAGEKIATGYYPALKDVWHAVNDIMHQLHGIFFPNCDGIVAADKIVISGDQLDMWTASTGSFAKTIEYPGTDSPVGCGANSLYYVEWAVARS